MTLSKWLKTLYRLSLVTTTVAAGVALFQANARRAIVEKAVDHVCLKGDVKKCASLAATLGKHGPSGMSERASRHACDRGDSESCWAVGMALRRDGEIEGGHAYFAKTCEMGRADKCAEQAKMHLLDGEMKPAMYAFEAACSGGDKSSCREFGRTAGVLGDTTRIFRAFHRLCYSHTDRRSCGRLAYVLWNGRNPKGALHAALHPCRGRAERPCLPLAPFQVVANEPADVVGARRLNLLEHTLTDFFNTLASVRRDGSFAGDAPAEALHRYQNRVAPVLQRARIEFEGDRAARAPGSANDPGGGFAEINRRYGRVLALSLQVLQQDVIYLQTGQARHLKVSQKALREALREHERARALLGHRTGGHSSSIASF